MFQNAAPALVLLLLMVAAAWFLQRYRRPLPGISSHKGPALQLMNTLSLGPQQRVVTVQLGEGADRVCLVLGVAPGSITALHQMPLAPALLLGLSGAAMAQTASVSGAGASLPLVIGQGAGGASYSVPIQTLLFFTALSFLPAVLLLMTGFTRIVIVLSLLRQALGTQSAPPNQVVVGLSLFLTLFVMGPTLDKVYQDAYAPYTANQISF